MSLDPSIVFNQNRVGINDISILERQVTALRQQLERKMIESDADEELQKSEFTNVTTKLRIFNWIVRQTAFLSIMKSSNIKIDETFIKTFNEEIESFTNRISTSNNNFLKTWATCEKEIMPTGVEYEKIMLEKKEKLIKQSKQKVRV